VSLETDSTGNTVTAIRWEKTPLAGTMFTDPGVYCLRSNELPGTPSGCGEPM
jgi:hypothetical protein